MSLQYISCIHITQQAYKHIRRREQYFFFLFRRNVWRVQFFRLVNEPTFVGPCSWPVTSLAARWRINRPWPSKKFRRPHSWINTASLQFRTASPGSIQVRRWICGGQSGSGAGFLRVHRFPLPILIPQTAQRSSIILSSTLYTVDTEGVVKQPKQLLRIQRAAAFWIQMRVLQWKSWLSGLRHRVVL
jgi:hypothetical protein